MHVSTIVTLIDSTSKKRLICFINDPSFSFGSSMHAQFLKLVLIHISRKFPLECHHQKKVKYKM